MGFDSSALQFYSFAIAALAYLSLLIKLVLQKGQLNAFYMYLAISFSVFWCIIEALSSLEGNIALYFKSISEILRGVFWVFFLLSMLGNLWHQEQHLRENRKIYYFLIALLTIIFLIEILEIFSNFSVFDLPFLGIYTFYDKLIIDVIILLLIENLYRNTIKEQQWGIKYFCIGLSGLFIYDFLLYADLILFKTQALAPSLHEIRGIFNILIIPFFVISASHNSVWNLKVQLSRKVVFHSFSLVGMGAYLIGMSSAGYFLQDYGGEWGNVLQGTFILIALMLLLFLLSSGMGKTTLKIFITKHFFKYRYDYRKEWLKLIDSISNVKYYSNLQVRSIQSVADIIDCPSGALWFLEQPDLYSNNAVWNMKMRGDFTILKSDILMKHLEKENFIIDLTKVENDCIPNTQIKIPQWLLDLEGLWLLIPLIHHDRMIGFMLITKPRVKFEVEWETIDILKTAARQISSYLAEEALQKELSIAKEFEAFNKQFAFVVHDIKNLTSQLSMLSKNALKYGDKPDFQKDMLLTVSNSVQKMESLLARISVVQEPAKPNFQKREVIELVSFLQNISEKYRKDYKGMAFLCREKKLYVEAVADELDIILMHIIQNSVESCKSKIEKMLKDPTKLVENNLQDKFEKNTNIDFILTKEDNYAIIKIKDDGEGMDKKFIHNELFRPFRSTKEKGYGIGAYEAREMLRKLGGRLEVKSKVGEGSVMTIYLKTVQKQVLDNQISLLEDK